MYELYTHFCYKPSTTGQEEPKESFRDVTGIGVGVSSSRRRVSDIWKSCLYLRTPFTLQFTNPIFLSLTPQNPSATPCFGVFRKLGEVGSGTEWEGRVVRVTTTVGSETLPQSVRITNSVNISTVCQSVLVLSLGDPLLRGLWWTLDVRFILVSPSMDTSFLTGFVG